MAFLFSSSHLPASRVRRPELEADEDHDENPEAMPRSGGVRASSHLEGRMPEPEAARSAGGSPAPSSSGAGIGWMGRLKELAEQQQQRRRADFAAPDSGPRRANEEHEPDAESNHDEDEAPWTEGDEAPEHEKHEESDDTRSWYHPPESGSYHPDPGFNVRPEDVGQVSSDPGFNVHPGDVGSASPDHGFYQHLPESEVRGQRDALGNGAPTAAQDWGARRSDRGLGQPQGSQRGVGQEVPAGSGPASGRTGAFPNSRLFEVRPHPALPGMTGAGGGSAQRMLGGQTQAGSRFHDDTQPAAGPRNGSPSSFAAQAVPSSKEERQPQGQAPSQPQQGGATKQAPAPPPNTALAQAAPPPAKNPNENLPTFKVDPADESKKSFMLRKPATGEKIPSDRTFGDHVRSIMQDELDKSPIARKLLDHITKITGRPVTIQMLPNPGDTAHPVYRSDGSIAIAINPTDLRSGTLSHEITHVLQRWARDQANIWAEQQKARNEEILKTTPKGQNVKLKPTDTNAINSKAREILHSIVPVTYEGERNNGTQDYTENEAMRTSHIVNAEISAASLRAELEAMKNSPIQRERDHYEWLIKHPANVAAMFWDKQFPMEQAVHTTNQGRPIPKSTRYGDYEYIYAKVLSMLNSPETPKEMWVSADHLKQERKRRVGDN